MLLDLLTTSGMDIFYISAIVIYMVFMIMIFISSIVHLDHIQFYKVFMRKDYRPSRLAITWIVTLPVVLYQSMTGDHQITSGLIELLMAVFAAELVVQGIDIANLKIGKFSVDSATYKNKEKELEEKAMECHCSECDKEGEDSIKKNS